MSQTAPMPTEFQINWDDLDLEKFADEEALIADLLETTALSEGQRRSAVRIATVG